jgi:hypothetical protein
VDCLLSTFYSLSIFSANKKPTLPPQSLTHPSIIPPQWIDTFSA